MHWFAHDEGAGENANEPRVLERPAATETSQLRLVGEGPALQAAGYAPPIATKEVLIVANRLPVHRAPDGLQWMSSPGGLATSLTSLLSERGGAWVGWSGEADDAPEPFTHSSIEITAVPISEAELDSYYRGMSNAALWPLFHDAIREPRFHRRWFRAYEQVNQRFAEAAARVAPKDGLVWVHDYQLLLTPGMLREMRPDLRIGLFLHIPFPSESLFARMPWRTELINGMLGADVAGFQTKLSAQNFARTARRLTGAKGSGAVLETPTGRTLADAFPISIDVDRFEDAARKESVRRRADELRAEMNAPRRKIVLGVDRLDYTKGIDVRLRAIEEVLSRGRQTVDDFVFVQLAVPSREEIESYAEMRRDIESLVGRINGSFSRPGRVAVHYHRRNEAFDELVALYLAADVMLVTPLCDGMNLIAKEYVATRLDDSGALVLSEFAGAAAEFKRAYQVNPFDVDGIATTIEHALTDDADEQRSRMRALRRIIARHDVHVWASEFIDALGGAPARQRAKAS